MQLVHLIFFDPAVDTTYIHQVLPKSLGIQTFHMREIFRKEMKGPFQEEILGYINNDQLVPTELVHRLILNNVQEIREFALIGYPRTPDQMRDFLLFGQVNEFRIETALFFILTDFNDFLADKLEKNKAWVQKFGHESNTFVTSREAQLKLLQDTLALCPTTMQTFHLSYKTTLDLEKTQAFLKTVKLK